MEPHYDKRSDPSNNFNCRSERFRVKESEQDIGKYLRGKDSGEVGRLRQLVLQSDEKPDVIGRQRLEDRLEVVGPRHLRELVLLGSLGLRQVSRVQPPVQAEVRFRHVQFLEDLALDLGRDFRRRDVVSRDVEHLRRQRGLDVEVERRRRVKRRRNVDLDEPGLQARVEEDVEAEELVADVVGVEVEPVDRVHGVLRADDRLDHLKSNNNAPSKLGLRDYSFACILVETN